MNIGREVQTGALRSFDDSADSVAVSALLPLKMLYAAADDATDPAYLYPCGRPGALAREAYEWLATTTGTRVFPILSADYCLHLVEPEMRRRIHNVCKKRHRDAEDYRQCLLASIRAKWERRQAVATCDPQRCGKRPVRAEDRDDHDDAPEPNQTPARAIPQERRDDVPPDVPIGALIEAARIAPGLSLS